MSNLSNEIEIVSKAIDIVIQKECISVFERNEELEKTFIEVNSIVIQNNFTGRVFAEGHINEGEFDSFKLGFDTWNIPLNNNDIDPQNIGSSFSVLLGGDHYASSNMMNQVFLMAHEHINSSEANVTLVLKFGPENQRACYMQLDIQGMNINELFHVMYNGDAHFLTILSTYLQRVDSKVAVRIPSLMFGLDGIKGRLYRLTRDKDFEMRRSIAFWMYDPRVVPYCDLSLYITYLLQYHMFLRQPGDGRGNIIALLAHLTNNQVIPVVNARAVSETDDGDSLPPLEGDEGDDPDIEQID